jgi:alkylglycerol monooxygenase
MTELQLLAMSYVLFLGLIGAEIAWSLWRRDGFYTLGQAVVNIGHGVVFQVFDHFTKGLVMAPFLLVASAVTWQVLPSHAAWGWLVGLVVFDFCSYWQHRHHHEIHALWAIHGVHHAAEDFNLAAALRQAVFQNVTGWLWKLPLALLVPLEMFVGLTVFDYLYQFIQHTRYVKTLGPLEWVFNTPSHHRVHHGTNTSYLDKNYGGILIIWDRLFGTYASETEAPVYGLTKPLRTLNPVWGNLAIFAELAAATGRASGLARFRLWLARPDDLARLAPGPVAAPTPVEASAVTARVVAYALASTLMVPPLLGWMLLRGAAWPLQTQLALGAFLVASTVIPGALLSGRAWATRAEIARWTVAVVAIVLTVV